MAVPARDGGNLVDLAAKAISLTAVLLPILGVLVRTIAFLPHPALGPPLDLALAAPIIQLIATGTFAAMLSLSPVSIYLALRRHVPFLHRLHKASSATSSLGTQLAQLTADNEAVEKRIAVLKARLAQLDPEAPAPDDVVREVEALEKVAKKSAADIKSAKRAARETARLVDEVDKSRQQLLLPHWLQSRVMRILLYVAGLLIAILVPGWHITLLPLVGGLLVAYYLVRLARRTDDVSLRKTWPLLILTLSLGVLGAGMGGLVTGASTGHYSFTVDHNNPIRDGTYTRLGSEGGLILLYECTGNGESVTGVTEAQVREVQFLERRLKWNGSLWHAVFHRDVPSLGVDLTCD